MTDEYCVVEAHEPIAPSQLFQRVFAANPSGIVLVDRQREILEVNAALESLTGHTAAELVGHSLDVLGAGGIAPLMDAADGAEPGARAFEAKVQFRAKSGREIPVLVHGYRIESSAQEGTVALFATDLTEHIAQDERLAFLAYHDSLTGLANRTLAQERFQQARAFAARGSGEVAFILIDLDKFKSLNETFGHAAGDNLLQEMARRVERSTRDSDTVARMGGDEILVLATNIVGRHAAMHVAEKLLSELSRTIEIEGHVVDPSVSIGVSLFPEDGREFDILLKAAEAAMYRAKEAGRATARFYSEGMLRNASEYLSVRKDLRRAIADDEFVLHFQPQIDLRSQKVVGAEALLRWAHPERGVLPPAAFIEVAEDSALIIPMGEWVLREACRCAAAWQSAAGGAEVVCAVNVSAQQLHRGNLVKCVEDALMASGLRPDLFELELTESMLIRNLDDVRQTLSELKEIGVQLSIDDFGTGYSSLTHLRRFRVDRLKIDRSFVARMDTDGNDAAIVRAMIQMAAGLGLKTTAEGVEHEGLSTLLSAEGCLDAQGYHFAKPLPLAHFLAFLAGQSG